MKIMLVIRWPVGGIKTYLQYLYRHQDLNKHTYVIVAPDLNLKEHIDKTFEGCDYTYYATKDSTADLLKVTKKVISVEKPDLVHSHGTTAGIIVSISLFISRTPHLLTTHDVFFQSQFMGFKGKLKKIFIKTLLNQASVINHCGFDAADNFKSFFSGFPKDKVKAIRNGIDIDKFQHESIRDLRNESEVNDSVVLLGFFGRFMSQ